MSAVSFKIVCSILLNHGSFFILAMSLFPGKDFLFKHSLISTYLIDTKPLFMIVAYVNLKNYFLKSKEIVHLVNEPYIHFNFVIFY